MRYRYHANVYIEGLRPKGPRQELDAGGRSGLARAVVARVRAALGGHHARRADLLALRVVGARSVGAVQGTALCAKGARLRVDHAAPVAHTVDARLRATGRVGLARLPVGAARRLALVLAELRAALRGGRADLPVRLALGPLPADP